MGIRIQAPWLLALGCMVSSVGGCGPTRTQLFAEGSQRLQQDDGEHPISDGGPVDPGVVRRDAGVDLTLDPDAVFDWEQTVAGSGECGAGRYLGTYECDTDAADSLHIEGVVSFALIPGTSETALLISPGTVSLTDPLNGDPATSEFWRAPLAGDLECSDGVLDAVGGPDQQVLSLFPLFVGPFNIRLDGQLDADAQEFAGEIQITQQVGGVTCSGTWTAKRTP